MMRDCEDGDMRDLLPGYVHGTLSAAEHDRVAAHLESCADCAAELELIETASRAMRAAKVDIARIVKAIPAAPRATGQSAFARQLWQLAAAIAIVAFGALSVIELRGYFGSGAKQTAALPQFSPRTAVATASVPPALAKIDSARVKSPAPSAKPRAGITFGGGISDLTDDQLNALLSELDGLETLPSAEPESHLTPIAPVPDGGHRAQ